MRSHSTFSDSATKASLLLVILLLGTAAETMAQAQNFWPMSDVSGGWNRPWWRYRWTNGNAFPSPYNWVCHSGAEQDTLTYLSRNDHAFAPPRDQIVVNMMKENICGYWGPTGGSHLKWYSEGWKEAEGSENVHGDRLSFLSFRGWTTWSRDYSVNTAIFPMFPYPGVTPSYILESGNGDYIDGSVARQRHLVNRVPGTRVAAEAEFPTYAIVPDESVTLNLKITSGYEDNVLEQYAFGHWFDRGDISNVTYHGCIDVHDNDADNTTMANVSATCDGEGPGKKAAWRLRTIPSTYKYRDKLGHFRKVIYSAFAEGIDGKEVVCEEWFFAENIGPIAMAQYPITQTVGACLDKLALAHGGVDHPETYYADPATRNRLIGFQWIQDYCLDNCWVGETIAAPTPD